MLEMAIIGLSDTQAQWACLIAGFVSGMTLMWSIR